MRASAGTCAEGGSGGTSTTVGPRLFLLPGSAKARRRTGDLTLSPGHILPHCWRLAMGRRGRSSRL
eukprot:scaffold3319_cov427-Prasinococcus_capsulatus_cf.AAC.21